MVSTRKHLQVTSIVMMLVGSLTTAICARPQSLLEFRSSARLLQRCPGTDATRADRDPAERFDRLFQGTENPAIGKPCDHYGAEENPTNVNNKKDDPPAATHQIDSSATAGLTSRLQLQPSIRASGLEAELIASASAEVLAILQARNACSAWFAKADPKIAETFASLQFWIERDGPRHIVREKDGRGNWIRHGPYIARTSESTGAGTNVAINASGAFFRSRAEVVKIEWQQGLELSTNTWLNLHIGPYDGATGKAQVIALLHELAHVVGAIPSDGMSPSGLNRSEENTEIILRRCKSTVDSTAKNTLIELTQNLGQ
jgi:hypothetical protein